jgi:ISXO2-like transposase domain
MMTFDGSSLAEQNIEKGSLINSDENRAYKTIRKLGYKQAAVRHNFQQWHGAHRHPRRLLVAFQEQHATTHKSTSGKHM